MKENDLFHLENGAAPVPDAEGVENEEKEGGDQIVKPFDPTLIRVESKPMTLGQLISRMRHGEIDMSPDFQRKAGIWKNDVQSRLIESILIRIPIPAFYFDASIEEKWIVVDGLQRLTTIKNFVLEKKLHLSGMEFLENLNRQSYDELPRHYQRRIDEAQIVVFLIEKNTPPEVKFNIFKRINTGGLPLAAQEIRHALNQGPVTRLLAELAQSNEFKIATNGAIKPDRMDDRECVVRFMAFVLTPPEQYPGGDFDSFLGDAMAKVNSQTQKVQSDLGKRFLRVMKSAREIFGRGAFRKYASRSYPINKALFETWSVCLDGLADSEMKELIGMAAKVRERFGKECVGNSAFMESISQSTGDPNRIKKRFSTIKTLIREVLNAKFSNDTQL